jgi:hypothetical protein
VSVLDEFRDAEKRVVKRLKELEPAVAEYRQLEEVAKRLGLEVTADARTTPEPARRRRSAKPRRVAANAPSERAAPSRPTRPRRSGRANASPGQRGEQLLALVRQRPGITVAEAGKEFSVDPTSLYRVVRRLEERGELRKNGRNLEPVGAGSSS